MREFLKGLELDKETIDTIMAEHGKLITGAKEKEQDLDKTNKELLNKIKTYEDKVAQLEKVTGDSTKIQSELDSLKKTIADNEAKIKTDNEEKILTDNVAKAFGDKKFINEYTKNALINDVKKALKEETNVGKSAKDIFEELTKDKNGIFENPNAVVDLPGADPVNTNVSKEAKDRELMGLTVETKK